jgi:broad specificity phosphatase PhoE
MATIYLVRHGKAAAGFDGHLDPGLDALGQQQAEAVAADLASLPPMPVYSSPLARARETAQPLAQRWQQEIRIEPRVAEIPSPTADLAARTAWLREAMAGRWPDLGAELQQWRQDLVDCLAAMPTDSVVFCHYIAINVIVGAAQDDDQVVVFSPDNASVTTIRTVARGLQVIELGRTANTQVN